MVKKRWETISLAEFDSGIDRTYCYEPHHFEAYHKIPWLRCIKCGLLTFNNRLSRWASSKGCLNRLHPDYKRKLTEVRP